MKPVMPNAGSRAVRVAGAVVMAVGLSSTSFTLQTEAADAMPNACPVDGCEVEIVGIEKEGDELRVALEANFTPDMSRNHVHVWWGENFTVQQVSNNAEPVHKVKQGEWHPTADYPAYVTQSAASTSVRGSAKTLCVSAADRNHDILDVTKVNCVDVSDQL